MKRKILFSVKQFLKMALQNVILPCVYGFWRLVYLGKEEDLIVFADAHHNEIPFSMERIHSALEEKGYTLTDFFHHFGMMSQLRSALLSVRFMRLYARAKYVFICDNFLPVSSCKKSGSTKVIQLWHCCGLMKKMGYDTAEDIPAGYKGRVYRNYDLMTVSAPGCVEPLTGAMRLEPGILQPLGVSRTDVYFDPVWIEGCKAEFYARYPQAKGKKILLWAPTFRGNAGDPYQVGVAEIEQLERQLGDGYFLIRKVHPHVDDRYHLSNCDIPTERLLPVTDLLISDYSTVIHEFLFFGKSCVLFAPDLEEYRERRGFYVAYESLSRYIVTDPAQLYGTVKTAMDDSDPAWIAGNLQFHAGSCDGNSTERILEYIGL